MLRCIGHTLLWIVPLVAFGIWMTFFDVFPEQYHRLIALGYVTAWVVAVWRIARCARITGARLALKGYSHLLNHQDDLRILEDDLIYEDD
jgi:hypothetical protein